MVKTLKLILDRSRNGKDTKTYLMDLEMVKTLKLTLMDLEMV